MKLINSGIKWLFETVLRKKFGLKKGAPGQDIKWYESETIWAGVAIGLVGTYEMIRMVGASNFGLELPAIPDTAKAIVGSVLGGTVVWGRWTSERNIE